MKDNKFKDIRTGLLICLLVSAIGWTLIVWALW